LVVAALGAAMAAFEARRRGRTTRASRSRAFKKIDFVGVDKSGVFALYFEVVGD